MAKHKPAPPVAAPPVAAPPAPPVATSRELTPEEIAAHNATPPAPPVAAPPVAAPHAASIAARMAMAALGAGDSSTKKPSELTRENWPKTDPQTLKFPPPSPLQSKTIAELPKADSEETDEQLDEQRELRAKTERARWQTEQAIARGAIAKHRVTKRWDSAVAQIQSLTNSSQLEARAMAAWAMEKAGIAIPAAWVEVREALSEAKKAASDTESEIARDGA